MTVAPTAEAEAKAGEKNGKKPERKPAPKPKPDFEVSHIEYIMFTPALDTTAKGTARRDGKGTSRAGASRTDRFANSRMFRTANDRLTIQTPQGEEIILKISVLEQMVARAKELQVTKEIPAFT